MSEGVGEHSIASCKFSITDPPRTIVDCYRYRNKIGTDIAMEGLRAGIRRRECTPDQLWKHGKKAHVWTVMRFYVETVLAYAA